jgi:hypothetical protein
MATSDLSNDAYVQRWLTGLADRTKENYLQRLPLWIDFIKMSPTEQIDKRLKDLTSQDLTERTYFEDKFREFKEELESKGNLNARSVTTMLTAVASFFSRNSLPLNLKRGDWKSTLETKVIKRWKITRDDIKRMYVHASLRDKVLLLGLTQSGFSEADISKLKIENIKNLYTLPQTDHYFIEKPREKTGEVQATCLSYEFLHDLRAMLSEKGNPETGYIFVSQTKHTEEPLDTRRINEAMKTLAERTFGKEKAKEFKTKALRSFYNSALLRSGIRQEVKDLMMGHSRAGARGHYDYDEYTIKEAYTRAFEHLSINGIQSREDLVQLKSSVKETKEEMAKIRLENFNVKYALDTLIRKLGEKGIKIDIKAVVEEEDRKYSEEPPEET